MVAIIGRQTEANVLSLAIACREHMLFVGTKGVAKSAITDEIAAQMRATSSMYGVDAIRTFKRLMSKTMSREEIEGALDIVALSQNSVYKRNTKGMLPDAHLILLDEVFNSSSAVLNTLNTMINEREYYNPQVERIPLMTLIGSTNCLPQGKDLASMEGFYDRFAFKIPVYNLARSMWKDLGRVIRSAHFDAHASDAAEFENRGVKLRPPVVPYKAVTVPDFVLDTMITIRAELEDNHQLQVSDRKYGQAIKAVGAWAGIHGRSEATVRDCEVLRWMWWDQLTQVRVVETVVLSHANPNLVECAAHVDEACRLYNDNKTKDMQTNTAIRELAAVNRRMKAIVEKLGDLEAPNEDIQRVELFRMELAKKLSEQLGK